MKKFCILLIIVSVFSFSVYSQGKREIVEETTTIDGTLEIVQNPVEGPQVYLIQKDGSRIQIMLSLTEMDQLMLQNREQIKIEGVFLDSNTQTGFQKKLFARAVIRNQERLMIKEPVQLSEQERVQLQAYQEAQELQLKNQVQQNQESETEGSPGNGNAVENGKGKN